MCSVRRLYIPQIGQRITLCSRPLLGSTHSISLSSLILFFGWPPRAPASFACFHFTCLVMVVAQIFGVGLTWASVWILVTELLYSTRLLWLWLKLESGFWFATHKYCTFQHDNAHTWALISLPPSSHIFISQWKNFLGKKNHSTIALIELNNRSVLVKLWIFWPEMRWVQL